MFIRDVDSSLNLTEEFLDLIPLKGTTTGRDIFQVLEKCIEKYCLPWDKLLYLATDGAPSMCSQHVGGSIIGSSRHFLQIWILSMVNFFITLKLDG